MFFSPSSMNFVLDVVCAHSAVAMACSSNSVFSFTISVRRAGSSFGLAIVFSMSLSFASFSLFICFVALFVFGIQNCGFPDFDLAKFPFNMRVYICFDNFLRKDLDCVVHVAYVFCVFK